jgi:hypothetical protein
MQLADFLTVFLPAVGINNWQRRRRIDLHVRKEFWYRIPTEPTLAEQLQKLETFLVLTIGETEQKVERQDSLADFRRRQPHDAPPLPALRSAGAILPVVGFMLGVSEFGPDLRTCAVLPGCRKFRGGWVDLAVFVIVVLLTNCLAQDAMAVFKKAQPVIAGNCQ